MHQAQNHVEYSSFEKKAIMYHKIGNFEVAEKYYSEILETTPKNTNILNKLGKLYYQTNRNDKALSCFKKGLEHNPQDSSFFNNYGNSLYLSGENIDSAIDNYKQAIEITNNYLKPWNNLGKIYLESQEFKKAFDYYSKSLKLNKNQTIVYNNLGIIYEKLGYLDDAISAYCEAIILNPNFIPSYFNLGMLFVKLNAFEDSEDCFRAIIKKDKKNPLFYKSLAKMFLKAKKLYDAENPYKDYLRLFPKDNNNSLSLSYIHILTKQYSKAEEIINNTSENTEISKKLNYQKGLLSINNKKYNEAIAFFNKITKDNHFDSKSLFYKNYCFLELGNKKEAKKIINLDTIIQFSNGFTYIDNFNEFSNQLKNSIEAYPFKIRDTSDQKLLENGYRVLNVLDYPSTDISLRWCEIVIRQAIYDILKSKRISNFFDPKNNSLNMYKIDLNFIKLNNLSIYTPNIPKKAILSGLFYIGSNSNELCNSVVNFGIANNLEVSINKEKLSKKSLKTTIKDIIVFPAHIPFSIESKNSNYYAHFNLIPND